MSPHTLEEFHPPDYNSTMMQYVVVAVIVAGAAVYAVRRMVRAAAARKSCLNDARCLPGGASGDRSAHSSLRHQLVQLTVEKQPQNQGRQHQGLTATETEP